ncbi:MAG: transposase [Candidatus Omnitrophica bacterium]|nr:transposase [Candidatus Omnitrophota bacterium]
MARPLRIEYPGALYHVTSRGNERKNILITDDDKSVFLDILTTAANRFKIVLHAYCLMTNHYHFLIETAKANLSKCMQYINSSYTTYFNRDRKRSGHLFQGRYGALLVEEESYLIKLSQYIHLNPIRAKLARHPADYKWSSYRFYKHCEPGKPDFLDLQKTLGYFNDDRGLYAEYIEEAIQSKIVDFLPEAFAGLILGSQDFIDQIKKKYVDKRKNPRDLPSLRKINKTVICPDKIIEIINANSKDIQNKYRIKLLVLFLRKYTDLTLAEISKTIGTGKTPPAISNIFYRLDNDRNKNAHLNELINILETEMCKDEV